MLALNLRNRNPGNLRPSSPPWLGENGENGGFVIFDTMAHGVRALAKNLLVYFDPPPGGHGLNTIQGIVSRWAPPADHNNTDAYIASVCDTCDVRPDAKLNLRDPDTLYWIVVGIGEHESNNPAEFHANVSEADINAGVYAALVQAVPA